MTYSIGFRAPSYQELAYEFLSYLQDKLPENAGLQGMYTDPDLTAAENAGEISPALQANIYAALQDITWKSSDIAEFLGHYLTEPKAHVYFDAPDEISLAVFTKKLAKKSVHLSLKSQLLFTQKAFYLNGEQLIVADELMACMRELADKRCLKTLALQPNSHALLAQALYEPYLSGFIDLK